MPSDVAYTWVTLCMSITMNIREVGIVANANVWVTSPPQPRLINMPTQWHIYTNQQK